MLSALEDATRNRWGHVEELAAVQVELLHALLAAFIRANSDPRKRPPKMPALTIPRPGDAPPSPPARPVIRPRDLARHLAGR